MPDIAKTVLVDSARPAKSADRHDGKTYAPEQSDRLLVYFAAVKAGNNVRSRVKRLLGRPGHSFDDYLRANGPTLNT